ncbi:MurR/RpiR family transcriptional regulator [Neobacillus niacini]|uniref:MurR/RpiR family transcriptional regulator n=1 Tax=Neobacillus niacini TaxID=86668 RepID=UPI0021CB55F1|nr:MurR/RpiR family transcriptional regulator [Neobacillus niacini]MCM3767252.1 MurR/RpiR family transcriptional regulator [Neobacillus niacini]
MIFNWDVPELTSSQKRIADFIEKSGERILYYSETELANELRVSNATISRFWRKIGYENFKAFKAAILEKEQLSPQKKLKNSLEQIQNQQLSIHEHLLAISNNQILNTLEELDSEQFKEAITLMSNCRKLYIHAPASAEGIAVLMKHRLDRFGLDIEILQKNGQELFESLMHIQKEDVIFLFGFVAMTPEAFVLLDYAKRVNYKTIIITDLLISDFQDEGDYIFYTNRGELWEFHSMIAPTFLVENFILGIGQYLEQQSLRNLEKLSELRKIYKEILPRKH